MRLPIQKRYLGIILRGEEKAHFPNSEVVTLKFKANNLSKGLWCEGRGFNLTKMAT